ncbi:uncharacterized protein BJX67DRAFT_210382 [Aspergillus lucknowensis]|uniref:EF-hand domain-containing protein n=1 Tax=Aspergillus lucknowensis TaxID=176173 RepID=A0ABR4M284_9EURO
MAEFLSEEYISEVREVFALFDNDGTVNSRILDEMLKSADVDGDGRIDYEKFVKMMMQG